MCGIAGIFHHGDVTRAAPEERLRRMTHALRHRGPDDEGYYLKPGIGLGHRRLSIIDLGGGHQPLCNEDESIWVVCNGEVYDFAPLRRRLEEKGHRFRTQSDSEILVHLYEEDGELFAQQLRGMFAFALWDEKKKRLILGRDRLGKKPLYYYEDAMQVRFASELKSFEAAGDLVLHLDEEILGHYLNLGFLPSPHTKYREVKKLPPAHVFIVDPGARRLERYWEHPFPSAPSTTAFDFSAAKEELRTKLREAVRIRMISDVPLGAFLSGGVDSSLVVALMTEVSATPVETFSVAFAEAGYDESPYARQVAEHLGTKHHELPVSWNIEELADKVLNQFDEPFADSSAVPQFLISQAARKHVTVALSGDGGDEFFAGYRRYVGRRLVDLYNGLLPRGVRQATYRLARSTVHEGDEYIGRSLRKMGLRFMNLARHYESEAENPCIPFFQPQEISELLGPELFAKQTLTLPTRQLLRPGADGIEQMLFIDQQSYLPDDILVKVDRMSMWTALEIRSPFLDHELIEWAARLPLSAKLHGFCAKYILKKLAEDYVPHAVLYRRKQGFALPLAKWFRTSLKEFLRDALLTGAGPGEPEILQRRALIKLYEEHQSGHRDWSQQLWALLSLRSTFRNRSAS